MSATDIFKHIRSAIRNLRDHVKFGSRQYETECAMAIGLWDEYAPVLPGVAEARRELAALDIGYLRGESA